MRRARRRGGEEVEHEVAVGDRVDRVRRHAGEAQLARDEAAIGREVHAGERARAERQLAGRAEHELEAPRVAPEHPEVREQVMREVDGLGALQVRVARHRPVLVALGELDERALQVLELLERLQRVRAREHRHVGRDLVVARARGVELAADRPDDLGQAPLDRHVDVLVLLAERERAAVELLLDALEPAQQRVAVGVADDRGRGEHRRVRARLLDVVGPEPPVEADRGVELAEDRVLGLREARHMGIMPAMEVVVRAARPDDPARRAALRLGGSVLRAPTPAARSARGGCCACSTRATAHTASWEVCRVAEAGGAVVGVLAAFPSDDGDALARRFVRLTLAHSPPWRIPALFRHLRATAAVVAAPAGRDALRRRARDRSGAPSPRRRPRAAGRRRAAARREAGLGGVALDTGIENRAARALYERSGFISRGLRPAPDERTARAVGGSGFIGYVKPR